MRTQIEQQENELKVLNSYIKSISNLPNQNSTNKQPKEVEHAKTQNKENDPSQTTKNKTIKYEDLQININKMCV